MNSYIFFRRIRWPILLLTFGITALLNQWEVLRYEQSWPLYLIVLGVLRLAEGAALSRESAWPAQAPGVPFYPTRPAAPAPPSSAAPVQPVTGIVPVAPSGVLQHGTPYPPSVEEES